MRKDIIFTSELLIDSTDKKLEEQLFNKRNQVKEYIETNFSYFNPESKINLFNSKLKEIKTIDEIFDWFFNSEISFKNEIKFILNNYLTLNKKIDFTCFLKGLFIYELLKDIDLYKTSDFIISFGKDICGFNRKTKIKIENSNKTFYSPEGIWGCFTSGNFSSRGKHILSKDENLFKSATVFGTCKLKDLPFMDAYATYLYSVNGNTLVTSNFECFMEKL